MPLADATTADLREMLIPLHLHYDFSTQSLRIRALAEIATKILYAAGRSGIKRDEVGNDVARITGIPRLPSKDIGDTIDYLKEKGIVREDADRLYLVEKFVKQIKADLENAKLRIDRILDKYFGTEIPRAQLEKWYRSVSSKIFSVYGDAWARLIVKRQIAPPVINDEIRNAIRHSCKEAGLEGRTESLLKGYIQFFRGYNDRDVADQIWSYSQAMLAARIINAGVGPDPLTINEFKGATFFLDTNVLCTAALEQSDLSGALGSLSEALESIGATLNIIHETKAEYERVVGGKRWATIKALENFSEDIVADAGDYFTETAIARGCSSKGDFERFFDDISKAPDSIGKQKIILEGDVEINKAAVASSRNDRLVAEIRNEWVASHPNRREKRDYVASHDAALHGAVSFVKKSHPAWVITLDRSMCNLSSKWAGQDLPAWISLDVLIQVLALAIDGAGPNHKPENFAPLLAAIIGQDLSPSERVFSPEDLDALVDLDARTKELSKEQIETFALVMAKARITGKDRYSSDVQLEINRIFQRKKIIVEDQVRELTEQVKQSEYDTREAVHRAQAAREVVIMEIEPEIRERITKALKMKTALFAAPGLILLIIGISSWQNGKTNFGPLLSSFAFIEILWATAIWARNKYNEIPTRARAEAEQTADERIGKAGFNSKDFSDTFM